MEVKIHCKYDELSKPRDLKVHPKNRNKHPKEQVERLAKIYSYQGARHPIILSKRSGFIVAGHGRKAAAQSIKMKEFPIVHQDFDSDEQEYAFIQSDNAVALWAELDLSEINSDIPDLGPDFDIDMLGIKNFTIDVNEVEPQCDEDEVPEHVEPKTKLGDIYSLGNHRLMCGDSTSSDDVSKLIENEIPLLMVTDPPYGVEYQAGWRAEAKNLKKTDRENTSSLLNDGRADWYDAWVLFPGTVAYVWHASSFTDVVMDSLRRSAFEIKQQIIWNKNVHALSRSHYHYKHEPCWYAVKAVATANWTGDRKQMTVWDVKNVMFEKDKTSHPTQKPIAIFEIPIENHTVKGDSIYEPFGGSGSQIIACEKTGRKSLCMELDPKFCDVIVARWEKYTGKKAELINGET
jgi:DNA modification methylase